VSGILTILAAKQQESPATPSEDCARSRRPLNLTDIPLISNWSSKESNNLILEIIINSHIKKAIFVYNTNKEFIRKFEGVIHAQK
jgi:hypothetical protein